MSSLPQFFNNVGETTTTTGTSTYTLAGAFPGARPFGSVLPDGKSCYYHAMSVDANGNPNGDFENGIGTVGSSGTTLSRDSITDTFVSGVNGATAVSWASGTKRIFLTAPNQAVLLPYFDVVQAYHGAGCAATTTGTVSSSSTSLVVASAATWKVGQGILIKGAGTAGAHHVTTVTVISGTTFTLNVAAVTGVTGAVVQHDDTVAVNAAIAAAVAAGGGTVFFPKRSTADGAGWYRCNAPLTGGTNSIITFPIDAGVSVSPPWVGLLGEIRGKFNEDASAYESGVVIDATDAPAGTGTYPAVVSGMVYAATSYNSLDTSLWNNLGVWMDQLGIIVAPNSTLSGLNFHNTYLVDIGDQVDVFSLSVAGTFSEPTHTTAGILFPGPQNNIMQECGACRVVGFATGIVAGEHLLLRRPVVAFSLLGLEIPDGYHLVSGDICIENCVQLMEVTAPHVAVFSVTIQCESDITGWWAAAGVQLVDSGATGRGQVDYANLTRGTGWTPVSSSDGIFFGVTNLTAEFVPDVPNDYIGKWDFFDENDAAANYDLTNVGGATFVSGHLGDCVQLNGSSQYLYNGSIADLGVSDGTLCGWLNADTATTGVMAAKYGSSTNINFLLYRASDGSINAYVFGDGAPATPASTAAGATTTGTWYFVSLVVDASSKTIELRLNNGSPISGDWTGTLRTSSVAFMFGCASDGGGETPTSFFDGKLDAWRLYDRQLTSGELTALYNGGVGVE